eukprot:CAMPEP_0194169122 /NCGR_PEP_ID=MMETSP0154-20130528/3803_1 /TAXON_ID=1049557 /ORGANISM="Thalassiothrix antarctica, Strain L6-D1" /LENGTH=233 /DNA_ID=CAMNT_0038880367 /DNA_START=33 /DNA_END=731 /DNA_ORIENTATION=+
MARSLDFHQNELNATAASFSPTSFLTTNTTPKNRHNEEESVIYGNISATAASFSPSSFLTTNTTPKNLNNGEESVIYGNVDTKNYYNQDDIYVMDQIETTINNEEINDLSTSMMSSSIKTPTSAVASSALPSHLVKHAAEFWFPECRDCMCCHGYKFGCRSCTGEGSCITCRGGSDFPNTIKQKESYICPPVEQHVKKNTKQKESSIWPPAEQRVKKNTKQKESSIWPAVEQR